MGCQPERFHILDIHDSVVSIDKSNGKRKAGVFHPEGEEFFRFIDKEHSLFLTQAVPEHQALGFFRLRLGHLNLQRFSFDGQSYYDLFSLLGEGGSHG